AGDEIQVVERPDHDLTVRDVFRIYTRDRQEVERLLAVPGMSESWRRWAADLLQKTKDRPTKGARMWLDRTKMGTGSAGRRACPHFVSGSGSAGRGACPFLFQTKMTPFLSAAGHSTEIPFRPAPRGSNLRFMHGLNSFSSPRSPRPGL